MMIASIYLAIMGSWTEQETRVRIWRNWTADNTRRTRINFPSAASHSVWWDIFIHDLFSLFFKWSSVLISLNRNSHPFTFFQRLNVFAQQKWQTKFHQKLEKRNKMRERCCQAFYVFIRIAASHRYVLLVFCKISGFFRFLASDRLSEARNPLPYLATKGRSGKRTNF